VGTTLSTGSRADAGEWQQRALDAEQKVARAHDAIRSGVMEQLKEKAMSSLVSQRSDMMEAQHAAAAEMAELERRLNELQTPLQDRLRAYEGRIADLEKALAAKGEENRELIKAKIALMRKQLDAERKGGDLRFN
jgi:FtsZ-binding cell division protein ZapB